ncbi:MAG: hypothetical protein LBR53_01840 [Deltaproteobacteria bacterium]|jgi:hypothetical protein|nr:hypothetical protein [Deltaproteobacteria bacterium]
MGVKPRSPVSGEDVGTKNGPGSHPDALETVQSIESNESGEPAGDKAEAPGRFSPADFPVNENG